MKRDHGLGLPDFYDYDPNVGPVGGAGQIDMMHSNWGDHGSFSKFMLGWITPTVVGSGSHDLTLNPSSQSKDALIIMPELTLDKGLSEYFVVQNRDRQGNDANLINDGVLIWHVDATATDSGFVQNNSYTSHKLIKLMEADGLEQIEQGLGVDANDYYQPGQSLTTVSTPDSRSYDNKSSGVEIKNITQNEAAINLTAAIAELPEITLTGVESNALVSDSQQITADVVSTDAISSVKFYVNGDLVTEDTQAPYAAELNLANISDGSVLITAEAYTQSNVKNFVQVNALKIAEPSSNRSELC